MRGLNFSVDTQDPVAAVGYSPLFNSKFTPSVTCFLGCANFVAEKGFGILTAGQ